MNLLIDENPSPRLVHLLGTRGIPAQHVAHTGLPGSSDPDVWRYHHPRLTQPVGAPPVEVPPGDVEQALARTRHGPRGTSGRPSVVPRRTQCSTGPPSPSSTLERPRTRATASLKLAMYRFSFASISTEGLS